MMGKLWPSYRQPLFLRCFVYVVADSLHHSCGLRYCVVNKGLSGHNSGNATRTKYMNACKRSENTKSQ
jgi:hypothetical protein